MCLSVFQRRESSEKSHLKTNHAVRFSADKYCEAEAIEIGRMENVRIAPKSRSYYKAYITLVIVPDEFDFSVS